jgi:hypothetical protein
MEGSNPMPCGFRLLMFAAVTPLEGPEQGDYQVVHDRQTVIADWSRLGISSAT